MAYRKKNPAAKGRSRTAKRSIRLDVVHPAEFRHFDLRVSCEDCSHFDPTRASCTIGYLAQNHLRQEQERTYNLGGRMAFCRFLELD